MEPATLVLFGATGDLAKRKIYPALYNLFLDGKLPQPISIFGLGRREWTDSFFQENVEKSLLAFSRRKPADDEAMRRFLSAFRYCVLDIGREEDYVKLLGQVERREAELGIPSNRMFYLSVGPEFFEPIALNIQASGLGDVNGWKRLVIEKPFGSDLESARALNRTLSQAAFTEQEIFRIDHYLGKPIVQRLASLQQGNPAIQALWTNHYIANVQITANETVGVEERAGFYDQVGAVRDMFQNHMMQLLMMAAIHLPNVSSSEKIRFKKKKVMEDLELLHKDTVGSHVVRGQYEAGTIQGEAVAAYRDEPGIANDSMTDTFIAARLHIDNNFWRGVPFYIRTGKRLKEKSTRIVVEFKEPGKPASAKEAGMAPNLLVFEIGPKERIKLYLNEQENGHSASFKQVPIILYDSPSESREAYENLILDAFLGDGKFFAHWDEVELSWQWVKPILEAYEDNTVPLLPYTAGSYGPAESDALPAADGFHWWFDETDKLQLKQNEGAGEQHAYYAIR